MAGELDQEINQLQIIVNNTQAELDRLKVLLQMAQEINQGDVTPELKDALVSIYQIITA